MKTKKKKVRKITPQEDAILFLARVVHEMPFCDYNVKGAVEDILGVKWVPSKK